VFAGFGLSLAERERKNARVQAAAARKARDEPVKREISGEAHGERDPVTGRWVRSHWYTVM
jgi:hypothetical protein